MWEGGADTGNGGLARRSFHTIERGETRLMLKFMLKEMQKRGADDVVLQHGREESSQIKFSNSAVDAVKNWDLSALLVFASFEKRIVITSVKDMSKSSLQKTAKDLSAFRLTMYWMKLEFTPSSIPCIFFNGNLLIPPGRTNFEILFASK